MKFEYDKKKSEFNKAKHGVDFEEVQEIWWDEYYIIPASNQKEERYLAIGKIKQKLYSCIYTNRSKNIRIISCRRSRKDERELYEKAIKESSNS